jgi:tripeptidyl-peptidase-1
VLENISSGPLDILKPSFYIMRFSTVVFTGVLGQTLASIVNHVVHEKRDATEHQARLQKMGTLPLDTIVPVRLAMKQPNSQKGIDLLTEV